LGTCVACDTADIVSRVSGQILAKHFKEGEMVQKGQLLYTIDPRIYEANVTLARGQLQAAQAKLELDRLRLARSATLVDKQYISPQELDNLRAAVTQSEGQVQMAIGNLQQAEAYLDFCSIRSPIAGLTSCNHSNVGNVVAPGSGNNGALLRVQALDPMYVDFSISENEFPQVYDSFKRNHSLNCEVSLLAKSSVRATARLEILDNQVSTHSGNVKLRAVLRNEGQAFWPGESVHIRLIMDSIKDAILAPEVAVNTGQTGRYVFVVNDEDRVEIRPVTLGQLHGTSVVFSQGLRKGEKVVTAGQFLLAPQTKVIVSDENNSHPSPALSPQKEKTPPSTPTPKGATAPSKSHS
jgi:multidrug efflux system membrane fusion protein